MEETFSMGDIVIKSAVKDTVDLADITAALERHAKCDWGDLECSDCIETNNLAAEDSDGNIMSIYHAKNGQQFHIITEMEQGLSTTTVQLDSLTPVVQQPKNKKRNQ